MKIGKANVVFVCFHILMPDTGSPGKPVGIGCIAVNPVGSQPFLSAPWVFNNDNGSADNCADNCANNCANNLRNDDVNNLAFRGAVVGSLGLLVTKVLLTCGTKCTNTFQM